MATTIQPRAADRSGRRPGLAAALAVLVGLLALASLGLLGPGAGEAEASGVFAWALDDEDTPTQLWVGTEVEVAVTIRNLGEFPWAPSLGDRLSYHWRSEAGELLVRDGVRTPITEIVGAGEAIELRARLRPPSEPGQYQLEWALVREGVLWFPPPEGGPRYHPITVEDGELGWAMAAPFELPARMAAGELVRVPVTVHNRGEIPWDSRRGDAIAYHWWSAEGRIWERDGRRTSLPRRVEPGDALTVELEVVAPSHAGPEPRRMCVELEPLRERVRWYGPPAAEPPASPGGSGSAGLAPSRMACTEVEPDPLGWALLTDASPTRMAIGDDPLRVPVVVQNTGTEPWAGDDRLAYRWRSLATGELIDGPRTALPGEIDPDEVVELDALVEAPAHPGRYELVWGLVREGERWYAQPDPASVTRVVEVGGERLEWGLARVETIERVWVSRTTEVQLELRNLGTEPWSEATGDHLSYHWLDLDGSVVEQDGLRTSFSHPIAPGESVVVAAQVRGPSRPGNYRLQWELVREHERWYGPPAQTAAGAGWEPDSLPRTRARWRSVVVALALSLVTVLGAIALRLRPPVRPWPLTTIEALPLVWAGLATWSLVAAFHELSGVEAWAGAGWVEVSGACLVALPLAFVRHRVRAWSAAAVVGFLALLALADLVYMHYFGSIVPIVALTASHHLGEVGDSAVAELERVWGWLAAVPVAGLIAAAIWPRTQAPALPPELAGALDWRRRLWIELRPRLITAGACLALASPAVITLGVALGGELGQRVFSEQGIVGRFGYVNAHLFDLGRNLRERGRRGEASPEELARVRAWFAERAAAVAAEREVGGVGAERVPFAAAEGDNLLLIQVEALQTWVIGLEVGGREVTPLLNRLRREADWYPYVVDQTNQGKTSDAEYAVLNSQHPLGEGAVCFLRADNQFHSLAHVLGERGYASLSAHPYKRGFWNRAVLHPRYGFERSLFERELGDGQAVGWGLADGLFFARIVPELRALPEPWFGFLITLSLHHPYDDFPDNLDSLDVGGLEGTRVGNYLEAMHYFDRSLAGLLADLDAAGLLDHTVVALYGDHDARFELDEYPEVLELAGVGDWDPGAFARLERVPLFVRVPDGARPPAGEIAEVGGHVDIGPTLLHSLGVTRPDGFVGRALVPSQDGGFAAYPDGSGYSRDRVYVGSGKGIPREGGCFEFPAGGSRPLGECAGLKQRAAEELEVSRRVVDFDLARRTGDGHPNPD